MPDDRAYREPWLFAAGSTTAAYALRDRTETVDLTDAVLTVTPDGGDPVVVDGAVDAEFDGETFRVWTMDAELVAAVKAAVSGWYSFVVDGDEIIVGPVVPDVDGVQRKDFRVTFGAAQATFDAIAFPGGGGGGAPSGGAGGFLSGSYPNPGVNLEALQDAVASIIEAGDNVTATYDDVAGTITIASTGGGEITLPIEQSDVTGLESALEALQQAIADRAPFSIEPYIVPGVGPLLIGIDAVDGTAEDFDLLNVSPGAPASGRVPADFVAAGTFPVAVLEMVMSGAFGPPANASAEDWTNTVVIVPGPSPTGAQANAYKLNPGETNSPWTVDERGSASGTLAVFDFTSIDDDLLWVAIRIETQFVTIAPLASFVTQEDVDASIAGAGIDPRDDFSFHFTLQAIRENPPALLLPGAAAIDNMSEYVLSAPSTEFADISSDGLDVRYDGILFGNDPTATNYGEEFAEILTQTDATNLIGGDRFEFAWWRRTLRNFPDNPYLHQVWAFGEHRPNGAESEVQFSQPVGYKTGLRVQLRWVLDLADERYSLFVPCGFDADDETADGRKWRLFATAQHADYGSINPDSLEPWHVGLRYRGAIFSLEAYKGPDGDPLLQITPAVLDAAEGLTSFTDAAGVDWTGGTETVIAPFMG